MIPFGLDISDYSIEVLQLDWRKKVKAFSRVLLEKGIIEDGKIMNQEILAKKIREAVKKSKIKTKNVIFSLPQSKVFVHFFKERRDILKQSSKIIPLDPDKIYFSIENGLYIACPKKTVNSYIEVLRKAGLRPVIAEAESVSLGRSLGVKDCLTVDIGARTTNLNIFDHSGNLRLSTIVNRAGNHFTQALSSKFKVSLKEAEKIKKECGLDQKKKRGKAMLVLQKEIQEILQEIKEAINFYEGKINQIILAGGSAQMPKIASYLSANLDIKVVVGKSPITKQLKGKSVLFNVVSGLALRGVNLKSSGINLLSSKEKKPPRDLLLYLSIIFIALSLIFLEWALITFIFYPFSNVPDVGRFVVPNIIIEEEEEEITIVVVKDTPTGWLRVREGPSIDYIAIDKVYPGESFPLLEEVEGWCKIEIEGRVNGWVSANYIVK